MSAELSLESCQSSPGRDITYLEDGYIFLEFKNNSDREIEIVRVVAEFQTELGLKPYVAQVSPMISVKPRNRSQIIRVPFVADLSLRSDTNSCSVEVTYKHLDSSQPLIQSYPLVKALIIGPVTRQVRILFLSHKDPEDAPTARDLSRYLKKIGFEGYLAEDDRRPGQDLWEKIKSKIDESLTLVALWTNNTEADAAFMKRELEYAISIGKKPVLFAEENSDVPDTFPKGIEFERIRRTEAELVEMVKSIERSYRAGVYDTR